MQSRSAHDAMAVEKAQAWGDFGQKEPNANGSVNRPNCRG